MNKNREKGEFIGKGLQEKPFINVGEEVSKRCLEDYHMLSPQ